ncbi:MAG: tyrosine--tRNA ligase [candidate division NC10 bacterium]
MNLSEQLSTIRRGTAEIVVESELRAKLERSLKTGVPLKVKLGLDPTAPDLHLGHTVVLQKLRDFQVLGHQAIIVIGDFTGMIGDPSGRSETRKPLTWEEIRVNAETYRAQLGKILDMSRTRVEFNSTWLGPLTFENIIRETANLTVAQMLQRDDFAARYASGRPISLHEFLYPIAQAFDSVALQADVELGGTDQTFNLLVGRDLQRAHGQEPQVAVTTPILEGLDGAQKMSKTLGNYVGITEPPGDMYGKLMSIPDSLMLRYLTLVTRLPEDEVREITQGLSAGRVHPMEAKKRLAWTVTAQYHGEAAAREAEATFVRVVQDRQEPENIDEINIPGGAKLQLVEIVVATGYVSSKSEARRKILEGAVDVDNVTLTDPNAMPLSDGRRRLIRMGKRFWRWVQPA